LKSDDTLEAQNMTTKTSTLRQNNQFETSEPREPLTALPEPSLPIRIPDRRGFVQLVHIRKPRLWFVLTVILLMCGALIGRYDYQWTLFLNQYKIEAFANFMGQTIFEGENLGASDFAVFYMLTIVGLYVYTERHPQDARWALWRPHIRFAVLRARAKTNIFKRRCTCAWLRCESLKYLDSPVEDPVVFSGRFRALPGRRLNT
jgi:hypothetical protein